MTDLRPLSQSIDYQQELFTPPEELALARFLSGYSGLTLEAYRLDLRQFAGWCTERDLSLFCVRRADIEQFGRHLEALGRARATVGRRLCTIACFYRYAEQEGLIDTHQQSTCAAPAWTTSPTPWGWTATKSVPCSSPLGWREHGITPWYPCWP